MIALRTSTASSWFTSAGITTCCLLPHSCCVCRRRRAAELLETALKPLLQADPDAAAVDWQAVQWLKGNQPWVPNFEASLADNGIGHKDQLRFKTPGLNSICAVS